MTEPGSTQRKIFFVLLVGQFLAMLDVQIVSASIEQLRADLNITNEEVSKVQTAYLTAEILAIPLTAQWIRRWGIELVYCVSATAFALASVLAGAANEIDFLIVARALQGFAGGVMLPAVFAYAFSKMPVEDRPRNSLLLSLSATLAPTLGPTFGGLITDLVGWRWLFFINIVPALWSALYVYSAAPRIARTHPETTRLDRVGFILLAFILVAFEYLLEEGTTQRWLDSDRIIIVMFLTAIVITAFIYNQLRAADPILEFKALGDRNFLIGLVMLFSSGITLLGGTFLLPLFLGEVLEYTPTEIGITVFVSGAAMLLTGFTVGRHVHKINPRIPMFVGFALAAVGFASAGQVTDQWSGNDFLTLQILRGVGVMIAVTVAQTSMMSTLRADAVPGASSLVFLVRNLGGAVGVAATSSLLTLWSASYFAHLSTGLGQSGPLSAIGRDTLRDRLSGVSNIDSQAFGQIYADILQREALIMAYQDCFMILAIGTAIAAVASLLMAPSQKMAPKPR